MASKYEFGRWVARMSPMGNSGDQPFACPHCYVIFGSGRALAQHMQSHSNMVALPPAAVPGIPWALSDYDKLLLRSFKITDD